MHREGDVRAAGTTKRQRLVKAHLRFKIRSEEDPALVDLATLCFDLLRLVSMRELDQVCRVRPEGVVPNIDRQG